MSTTKIQESCVFLFIATLLSGCGDPQVAARKDLAGLGKDFNAVSFIESVANGDQVAVKRFLAAGINVNERGRHGVTALMAATSKRDLSLVRLLLDNKADPNAQDDDGIAALSIAASRGNSEIVAALLAKNANPNLALRAETTKGITPLLSAVLNGHTEITRLLLANGAEVNAKALNGLTATDFARGQTNLEILKLLWDYGAPVVTDAELESSLDQLRFDLTAKATRSMINGESADACRRLIAEQLLNFRDQEHFTTNQLLQARVCAFRAVAKAVQKLADEESVNGTGVVGANEQRRESIKQFRNLLIEIQVDPAVQRGVLVVASHLGEVGTVKWLLEHGAPVNVKDQDGFTPLMWAAFKGDVDTVKVLLNGGADADLKDRKGWTATMFAASQSRTEVLEALLTKKPDLNAVNQEGQNALGIARLKNQTGAVVALKEAGASEQ